MNMKLMMGPPLFILATGQALTTAACIAKEDYSQVAFTGMLSFLFFHFGMMVMKYGLQPWRVVTGLHLLAGTYAAWSISFALMGSWFDAAMQAFGALVWSWSARRAHKSRIAMEAEKRAKGH